MPGAWFQNGTDRIKLLSATPANAKGEPGTVVDELPTVACGQGGGTCCPAERCAGGVCLAPPDAGAPDAGPFDAGTPDAGPFDAGP